MKKDQYFKLEVNLLTDDQVAAMMVELDAAQSFGVYTLTLMHLRTKDHYSASCAPVGLRVIARRYGLDVELLKRVIFEFGLFEVDEESQTFHSPYLDRVMTSLEERWRTDTENGKKGGRPSKRNKNAETPATTVQKPHETQEKKGEEKRGEEKRNITTVEYNSSNIREPEALVGTAAAVVVVPPEEERRQRPLKPVVPWPQLVDVLSANDLYMESAAIHSGLGALFVDHRARILELFKEHIRLYSKEGGMLFLDDVKRYFSNFVACGSPTCRRLRETLLAEERAKAARNAYRFEELVDGRRTYFGHSIPDDAPPRPDATAVWDAVNHRWTH